MRNSSDNGRFKVLFESVERTDLNPAKFSGSNSQYLRTSARREFADLRRRFESWFSKYPDSERRRCYSDFHSADNKKHSAAKFELFCHELLLRLGASVVCQAKFLTRAGRGICSFKNSLARSR